MLRLCLLELFYFINCLGYLIYFLFLLYNDCTPYSVLWDTCICIMYHVEHSLCNLNCARVKVHFATRCHAETPSRAAQGSEGNGL